MIRIGLPALLALLVAFAAPATAAEPAAAPDLATVKLKAGRYVWKPELATEGALEIVISLADQRAFVYRGGTLIGVSTVSSGVKGRESPVGPFRILEKRRFYRSARYDNAPMPFMQRLNWYGIALHAGHVPGYRASDGCIRLPEGFAKALFGATEVGSYVYMTDDKIDGPDAALEMARLAEATPLPPDRSPREFAAGTD
jgi:hypothetical protein